MISDDVVQDLKNRLHITHESEDNYIESLLTASYAYIKSRCGDFLIDSNQVGRELVMERAKFAYEGQLAYFDEMYAKMLVAFSFDLQIAGDVNEITL